MKLSTETISVLKNFGAINQGILFKKGKTLKTVSSHKNILAEVTIKEDIPAEFGVYDLNNFLSVVSLTGTKTIHHLNLMTNMLLFVATKVVLKSSIASANLL